MAIVSVRCHRMSPEAASRAVTVPSETLEVIATPSPTEGPKKTPPAMGVLHRPTPVAASTAWTEPVSPEPVET